MSLTQPNKVRAESAPTRVIWKFPIPLQDNTAILMPEGAHILSAGEQNGTPTLWAEVDPKAPKWMRRIYIRGTGHSLPGKGETFIDTVHMPPFVWHIYDGGEFPC